MAQAPRRTVTQSLRIDCPACGEAAQSVRRGLVEYDRCPGCGGVWLDCGELETLLALAHRTGKAARFHAPA